MWSTTGSLAPPAFVPPCAEHAATKQAKAAIAAQMSRRRGRVWLRFMTPAFRCVTACSLHLARRHVGASPLFSHLSAEGCPLVGLRVGGVPACRVWHRPLSAWIE